MLMGLSTALQARLCHLRSCVVLSGLWIFLRSSQQIGIELFSILQLLLGPGGVDS